MEKKSHLPQRTSSSRNASNMEELPAQTVMEFFELGFPITNTPEHVVLKKSNDAIRVKGNTLDLIPRKVVDACFYIARQAEQTGASPHSGMYYVSTDYFYWLIDFNSRNFTHLKKKIGEIMESPIEINVIDPNNPAKDFWLKTNFLNEVCITGGKVYFTIPESIRQTILNPRSYTNLSFCILHSSKSLYTYILYQECRSELYRGVTEWWDIDQFRGMMNTANLYPELQDFHKRVVYPAMDQINGVPGKFACTDIHITPDYQYKGRKKTHIRFFVVPNPGFAGPLVEKEKLPRDIYETLKSEFGFSNSQVDEVTKYPVEYLTEKIEFARYRVKSGAKKQKPVKNPTGFLLSALKEDLRLNDGDRVALASEQKALVVHQEKAVEQAERADVLRGAEASLAAFKALVVDEQKALLDEFQGSSAFGQVRSAVEGELTVDLAMKNAIVRFAFTRWLAGK